MYGIGGKWKSFYYLFRFFQLPNHAFNCKQLDTHILLYYGEFTSCLAKAYIESRFIRHGGAETSQENMKEIWKILNPSIQQPQHQLETLRLINRWPKRERTPELLSLSLKNALTRVVILITTLGRGICKIKKRGSKDGAGTGIFKRRAGTFPI